MVLFLVSTDSLFLAENGNSCYKNGVKDFARPDGKYFGDI